MNDQKFVRIAQAAAAICVLASTFSVDPTGPHYALRMIWAIAVTGVALLVGIYLGAHAAKSGIKKLMEAMDDDRGSQDR